MGAKLLHCDRNLGGATGSGGASRHARRGTLVPDRLIGAFSDWRPITPEHITAIAAVPSRDTIPKLVDVLRSGSQFVAEKAQATLMHIAKQGAGKSNQVIGALIPLLDFSDSDIAHTVNVRCGAAELLGQIGNPKARNALSIALGDETRNPTERQILSEALKNLPDEK